MTRDEFHDKLVVRAAVAKIDVAPDLQDRLWEYYRLLVAWNRTVNLTAVNLAVLSPAGTDRLFIEPLAASRHTQRGLKVIDVGSGGGSPAIPFALATGATALTMVESRSRKSVFLQEASRAVGLRARVVTSRFEDAAGAPELQRAFDVLTVRAVRIGSSELNAISSFVRDQGELLLFQRVPLETEQLPKQLSCKANVELAGEAMLQVLVRTDVPRGTSDQRGQAGGP